MARVKRIDIGTLAKIVKRSDGTIIVQARLARTGVYSYADPSFPSGYRLEYRSDSAVFDGASLESFRGRVVTNDHPADMLTAETAKQHAVGTILTTPKREGKFMIADLSIYDAAAIRDMANGKTQVSNGYDCDLLMTPGISPEGERYDCVQSNIEGNHVAIVHNARAGKDAAVRMDAAAVEIDLVIEDEIMTLEQALAELAKTQKELGAVTARADAATADLKAMKSHADKLEGDRDGLKTKLDASEKARKDSEDAAPKLVRARIELESTASKHLKDPKFDGMSDRAIKVAVIKHVSNVDVADAKSDDYVAARYDAAIEQSTASKSAHQDVQAIVNHNRTDDAAPRKDDAARTEMLKKHGAAAYIQPTK